MWVFRNLLRRQQVAPIVQMLGQKATTECNKLIRKCFKQSGLNNNSWLTFSITSEVTLLKPLNVRINSSIRVLDQSISGS